MKTWVLPLALLTLCLGATPAIAQNDLYDNGPTNGQSLAWAINFGFAVSDSFDLHGGATLAGVTFAAWLFPGDVMETAEVSITSSEFGGTSYFDQIVSFTQSGCFANNLGYNVCNETGSFRGDQVNLNPGTYWLDLQNATVTNDDPVFWDMNSGPSLASENSLGTIPSESFTIIAGEPHTTSTTTTGDSLPEPTSIMLFGSGVLGIVGFLRRQLF